MPTMTALEQKLAELNKAPPEPAPEAAPKSVSTKTAPKGKGLKGAAAERQAELREKERVHIGAWLHKDFKRGLLLVRAATGDDVQTIIARALNNEFRAHSIPQVKI